MIVRPRYSVEPHGPTAFAQLFREEFLELHRAASRRSAPLQPLLRVLGHLLPQVPAGAVSEAKPRLEGVRARNRGARTLPFRLTTFGTPHAMSAQGSSG